MRRQDKEEQKFSSQAEKKAFDLYQHVAQNFMKANIDGEYREYGETVYTEPSEFRFSPDARALVVEYESMYDRPKITFDFLESLSEAFKTKHIDLENGHSQSGCETCDYGSSYGVVITLKNIGINFDEVLNSNIKKLLRKKECGDMEA